MIQYLTDFEVVEQKCTSCENHFFEFNGYELDKCPHCKNSTVDCIEINSMEIKMELNTKTGDVDFT